MTREEAIKYLKSFKLCTPYTMDAQGVYYRAVEVAIKALEQEPIIDKINELIEPLRHLSIDQMSDIEWLLLRMIDKYKAEREERK